MIDAPKKVMFSIGVKVFPYNSEINSIRMVLVKLHPLDADSKGGAVADGSASKSKKSKSRAAKSKKSRADGENE